MKRKQKKMVGFLQSSLYNHDPSICYDLLKQLKGECEQLCQKYFNSIKITYTSIIILYISCMINSTPKATASMVADTTETRYQKALKEINKLITINTELKDTAKDSEEYIVSLEKDLRETQETINEILTEKEDLQRQLEDLTNKHRDLEEDYLELEKKSEQIKQPEYFNKAAQYSHQSDHVRNSSIHRSDNSQYIIKIEELEQKVQYQQNKIEELAKTNDLKNISLLNENQLLKAKIEKLEEGLNEFENYKHGKYTIYTEQKLREMNREDLIKKLKVTQLWNRDTVDENVNLKSKLLKIENQENLLLRIKSQKQIPSSAKQFSQSILSPTHNRTENSTQIVKKLKKMTEQKNAILKKNTQMKLKIDKIDNELVALGKQNDKNLKVIEAYQKVLEKQEDTIKLLVEEYEQDIQKLTEDFKEKIIEQREHFGPAHGNQKHFKQIESLQSQNKSLKKKFQMCSIQLTKCFKTLEVYKTKLSQYEFSYTELMKQNQSLSQKLISLAIPDPSVRSRKNTALQKVASSQQDEPLDGSILKMGKYRMVNGKGIKNAQY